MINLLILLLFWHFLADFPLQGDFLARWKDPRILLLSDINAPKQRNPIWHWCLLAHCTIQAGGVYLITGWWPLFVAELMVHALIDWAKLRGRISFSQDQALHIGCKVAWVALLVLR